MNQQQLIDALGPAQVSGDEFEFSGIEIDSRKDCNGKLFVAIAGENFDGHDFVRAAANKGAAAAIVESLQSVSVPQLQVDDCRQALGTLAAAWRQQMPARIVAITGSNGKTTVKEMLGRILASQHATLMTEGNLNNDIGVPLTLFGIGEQHRFAVIEMGANHVGEIRRLVEIAQPDVVYVNNARAAHVEGFGSLRNVISAKGEMYRYCPSAALAVFNGDESTLQQWRQDAATPHHSVFSMQQAADVQGDYQSTDRGLRLRVSKGDQVADCDISVFGPHNAQNALAAVTLALACGIELEQALDGLQGFDGVKGRQQFRQGLQGCRIIDDSYNANPDSLQAALDVLCGLPGRPWLALGDMAELGDQSAGLHDDALRQAQAKGVERLFALGEHSCRASHWFGDRGHCFERHAEMAQFIAERLSSDVNLLIKGSRSAHMEQVVKALTADAGTTESSGERHAV